MNDRTNGFKDSRDYMSVKKSKLAQQNDRIRESLRNRNSTLRTDIFKGISINVNGRTQPTADELKRLILLNGGEYHPYYRYQTTKFMIATNLSAARIKQLRPDDRVVKPEWITDSIQEKCLLSYQQYQLYADEPRGETNASSNVLTIEASSNSRSPIRKGSKPPPPKQTNTMDAFVIKGIKPPSRQVATKTSEKPDSSKNSITNFIIKEIGPKTDNFMNPLSNISGETQIDEVIAALNEWVGCNKGITDEDTATVTKYFYDLMNERNYHNKFYEIISALQQRVVQHDDSDWIAFFNNLVNNLKIELHQSIEATQNLYQIVTLIEP